MRFLTSLIIVMSLIVSANKSYSFTEDQCYFYNSLIFSAPKCLKEAGSLGPSIDEIKILQRKIITPCFAQHKDATLAAPIIGVKDIRNQASCDEIIDEYIKLFKKFGLTGNLVEPVPDNLDELDDLIGKMLNN